MKYKLQIELTLDSPSGQDALDDIKKWAQIKIQHGAKINDTEIVGIKVLDSQKTACGPKTEKSK